jgi:hypothetical protein
VSRTFAIDGRTAGHGATGLRWHHESLPYDTIDRAKMAKQRLVFYLLTTASFVEITTDLYTRNLIDYYRGDDEIQGWLAAGWEPEELQHGRALRRYVGTVWPDFDWEATYRGFLDEYRECCKVELLGPTRALEMARRCIVETGTCSYYTMIQRLAPCPVLAELAGNIRKDEAGHYRHFYDYFRRYRQDEAPPRRAVLNTLIARIREIDREDGYIAFKHVWSAENPGQGFDKRHYRRLTRAVRTLAADYYPFRMAATMAMKPLGFSRKTQRRTETALAASVRFAARVTGSSAAFN